MNEWYVIARSFSAEEAEPLGHARASCDSNQGRSRTMIQRLIYAALLVFVLGCAESNDNPATTSGGTNPSGTPPPPATASLNIAFAVGSSATWAQVKDVVQPNDFVLVLANQQNLAGSLALAEQIVADKPGVHVVFGDNPGGLNSVTTMDSYLTAHPLPAAIEYVLYDFEPNFQPEFTFIQTDALPSFEQAKTIAAMHGKKVFPTPFNPFRAEAQPLPWDMGAVALRSHDAMDVQLQQSLNPANPGGGLSQFQTHARRVRDDVRATRPDLKLFVQMSFAFNTATELADAATWVKTEGGFAGVFIIYDMNNPAELVSLVQAIR